MTEKQGQTITKVVIPAAGWGTRFLPQTKATPKEMLPIIDKPVIQYVVEDAVSAGIEDILIVTGWQKRNIEDHFGSIQMDKVVCLCIYNNCYYSTLQQEQHMSDQEGMYM